MKKSDFRPSKRDLAGLGDALIAADKALPRDWLIQLAPLYEGGWEVLAYDGSVAYATTYADPRHRHLEMCHNPVDGLQRLRKWAKNGGAA